MKTESKKFGWKMLILWILVYVTGHLISGYVAEYIVDQLGKDAWMITYPIAGMGTGFVIGFLQWLLLFRFRVSFWWVIASTIGGIFVYFIPGGYGFFVIIILQTVALYARFFFSGFWIVANVPFFFIRDGAYFYLRKDLNFFIRNIEVISLTVDIVATVCSGIITGLALMLILDDSKLDYD